MMQFRKSQVAGFDMRGGFAEAVAGHAGEMNAWLEHMANVGKNPTTYEPYKRPASYPLLDQAIAEVDGKFVPSFEIVNDDPPPELVLQRKKNDLLGRVSAMETVAAAAVVPAGKRRLFNMRHSDIVAADAKRRRHVIEDNARLLQEALNKIPEDDRRDAVAVNNVFRSFDLSEEETQKRIAALRPPEDSAFLEENAARAARHDAIARHGARLHAEVEDLTAENVDKWKPAGFPV